MAAQSSAPNWLIRTARAYVRIQTAVVARVSDTVTTAMGTPARDSYKAGSMADDADIEPKEEHKVEAGGEVLQVGAKLRGGLKLTTDTEHHQRRCG